ncbi:MAG: hypothetical protein KDB80_09485, partial [Planctomycetes bacterium]|nr:hypothetical protein [Planctomycetota bacterium]
MIVRLSASFALLAIAVPAQQDYSPRRLNADGAIVLGTANAIANDGTISGLGSSPAGDATATSWTVGSNTTVLPALPGDSGAEAFGCGPGGLVTGASYGIVPVGHQLRITPRAVIWVGGSVIELDGLFASGAT